MNAPNVIKFPRQTEKGIKLMESNNTLVFVVDKNATKQDVRQAVELTYKAKVVSVNTHVTRGEKRAFVKFAKETPAIDVATALGLI